MSAPATTLNFRLLCAAGCAYDIPPNSNHYTPDPVYSPVVNYTSNPAPVCGGTGFLNACLVGQNADGILVAFRGTLPLSLKDPESFRDWLTDFFAAPKTAPDVPGQVHSGFYDDTMTIIDGVAKAVQALNPSPTNPVLVTGHSLGGAMASIGAYLLSQTYKIPIRQVVTFASPKPGDPAFQAGYQSVIKNQIRYENFQDVVPLVPPADSYIDLAVAILGRVPDVGPDLAKLFESAEGWNYVPVGSQLFIESNQQTIISNESIDAQVWDVVKECGEDLLHVDFSSFGAAHTIHPGYGYYRALSASAAVAAQP